MGRRDVVGEHERDWGHPGTGAFGSLVWFEPAPAVKDKLGMLRAQRLVPILCISMLFHVAACAPAPHLSAPESRPIERVLTTKLRSAHKQSTGLSGTLRLVLRRPQAAGYLLGCSCCICLPPTTSGAPCTWRERQRGSALAAIPPRSTLCAEHGSQ